jgi:transposase-like protein
MAEIIEGMPDTTDSRMGQQQLARDIVEQARAQGIELVGPGGLLTGLTKTVLETALEAEMSEHLGYDKHAPEGRNRANSRNGSRAKTVLTELGPVEVDVPRDRVGTFEPVIVKKGQRRLDGIDQIVLSLTARGLTTGEICAHFAEVYGASVGKDTISRITDKVVEEMTEWVNRPLDRVYPVVFIDAIMVKVRDGQVANRPIYVVGVTVTGERDILGLWAGDGGEGAKFWLQVLTEVKNRGVADVCMLICDGLTGLPDAVAAVWPLTVVQTSSLHTPRRRDRLAGHRAAGRGPMQTRALEALTQTMSLPVVAGRVVASGSRASSAVMRFHGGRPDGDLTGKDGCRCCTYHRRRPPLAS